VDHFWQLKTSKITSFLSFEFFKISLCGEISPKKKKKKKKRKLLIMTVNKQCELFLQCEFD
jgi:hypothetical protein